TNYIPVLAGMGTHLILEILESNNQKFNKIITVSNNNHDILRKDMSKEAIKVFLLSQNVSILFFQRAYSE
ncbi:MAG: tRNA (adenine(22)-N(1))-methyltransferase TrmK, partial [Ruminococcus sp.]|nr:tRNA (adenine(22)-N(1))-methyltransferase TrmK [Ruminococcus sp.]